MVEHLSKRYGTVDAVRDVSFTANFGEVLTLVGPNGAGKTTIVEILEGLRCGDSGVVLVLGERPSSAGAAWREQIGVELQGSGFFNNITPYEALWLFSSFYTAPRDTEKILKLVGLWRVQHVRYSQLSAGQRQRLALALAIINRPKVVFLDEPTTSLDPEARRETWALVKELRGLGVCIVLSTHDIAEAETVSDRVAILVDGQIAAIGSPKQLVDKSGADGYVEIAASDGDTLGLERTGAPISRVERSEYVVRVFTPCPHAVVAELGRLEPRLHSIMRSGAYSVHTPQLIDAYFKLTATGHPQ